MTASHPTPEQILHFWFEDVRGQDWPKATAALDARVRRKFARPIREEARRYWDGRHPWMEAADSALALIILFDQFPRHVWRGSNKAFAFDGLAREIARHMVSRGWDWAIEPGRRSFIYLPFMHSEDLADQELSVELYRTRRENVDDPVNPHAIAHRELIERFGRFPYRNEALGRSNTADEEAWLAGKGYRPG
ncbi:DUF924 family protein [Maricaulis sp. CAU 1757]